MNATWGIYIAKKWMILALTRGFFFFFTFFKYLKIIIKIL